jgi:hypothetical protein
MMRLTVQVVLAAGCPTVDNPLVGTLQASDDHAEW